MNPLDTQIITRKCNLIIVDLAKLENYKDLPLTKYLKDDLI
jgi:uncharacterized protein YkvS